MNTIEERASFTPLRILLLLSLYLFSMVVGCSQPAARRSANPDYFLWLKSRQDYCSVDETEGGGSATRNGEMSGKLP